MRRRSQLRRRVAALGLVVALTATGCSAGEGGTRSSSEDEGTGTDRDVTVIEPGRPGEPAQTIDPDEVVSEDRWNHSDVAFMQMMIPHHAQALEMSGLAATRAADERVLSLARRIRGAQGPEIITMSAWLEARRVDVPKAGEDPSDYDHGAHGHTEMTGMLTDEEMKELAAARGRRFDRLFLQSMIDHHHGAVAMAQDVATEGEDARVSELAADVVAGQSAEIDRMRELLAAL